MVTMLFTCVWTAAPVHYNRVAAAHELLKCNYIQSYVIGVWQLGEIQFKVEHSVLENRINSTN